VGVRIGGGRVDFWRDDIITLRTGVFIVTPDWNLKRQDGEARGERGVEMVSN